jgi:cell division protein FtsB
MDWTTPATAVAAFAALLTAIASYAKSRGDAARASAEREEVLTRAAISLITPLKVRLDQQAIRITELETQVLELRRENQELHAGINVLCGQISALGDEPRWRPVSRGRDGG